MSTRQNSNLIIALLLFGFISICAQTDETKEKLKNLEGDVTKITIETANGDVEISGDDAAILFKKMRAKKHIIVKEMNYGDIDKSGNVMFLKEGMLGGDITIDVNIDETDGEKVVVIKKNIDGKEIVEEYKGEEAEKFLEKHSEGEKKLMFISEDDDITTITMDSDDFNWSSEDDTNGITKKINVEIEDGEKTVTVTTTENGEEKVEVYEGDEADEYLDKMENGKKMKIYISEDGNKTIIKKEIIIIEEEDDKN